VRAVALLSWWQVKNALRTTLTTPRKLIPALVFASVLGLQFMAFVLSHAFSSHPEPPPEAVAWMRERAPLVEAAIFLGLTLIGIALLDSGFREGFLNFTLADIDLLFPAPVPRRVVLAYRLAARTGTAFLQWALVFVLLVWQNTRWLAPDGRPGAGAPVALVALFLYTGGCLNLAFALRLITATGNPAAWRRWLWGAAAALVTLVAIFYFQGGSEGAAAFARSRLLAVLLAPARLTAAAVVSAWGRGATAGVLAPLALFYGAGLALLFSRNEPFYELTLAGSVRAARRLQAAREQNWQALFALRAEGHRGPRRRPYALPPFGRGGGALLWANLTAALKRPWANFALPVAAGLALPPIVAALFRGGAAPLTAVGAAAYLLFLYTSMALNLHRQAVSRLSLVKPLPIPDWQVAASEVGPRALLPAFFGAAAGLSLWVVMPSTRLVLISAVALVACLPVALTWLSAGAFILALWYPNAQDKVQQMLAGFIAMFFNGLSLAVSAALFGLPVALGASPWAAAIVFDLLGGAACAALVLAAGAVYRRVEPAG
jgi:Putative ABC exporter